MQGVGVWSLVWELTSHMPCSTTKQKKRHISLRSHQKKTVFRYMRKREYKWNISGYNNHLNVLNLFHENTIIIACPLRPHLFNSVWFNGYYILSTIYVKHLTNILTIKVKLHSFHFTYEERVSLRGEATCPCFAGVKIQHFCIFYSLIIGNATKPDQSSYLICFILREITVKEARNIISSK